MVELISVASNYFYMSKIQSQRGSRRHNFDRMLALLDEIQQTPPQESTGTLCWPLSRICDHCTFGILSSMDGYPELKAKFYRLTIGRLAFHIFMNMGRMRHNTTSPIPSESLANSESLEAAISRMRQAIDRFRSWSAPLKPHFAYGRLSKSQYEQVHCLHLEDHLRAITP